MQAANPHASDLRPKAVFSVLVAGHRAARLQHNWFAGESITGSRQTHLQDSLQQVLTALRNSAARACKQAEGVLQATDDPEYRLLTGSADGTDALARELATPCGFRLQVVSADEPTPTSVTHADHWLSLGMTPRESERELDQDAYSVRDTLAASFADVLIAVWDDQESAQIRSGTARLIRTALLQRKPVVLLYLSSSKDQPQLYLSDLPQLTDARLQELETLGHRSELLHDCFQPCDDDAVLAATFSQWLQLLLTPFAPAQHVDNPEARFRRRIRAQRSLLGYSRQWLSYSVGKGPRPLAVSEWLRGVLLWFGLMLNPRHPTPAWQLFELLEEQEPRSSRHESILHHLHLLCSALLRLDAKALLAALRPDPAMPSQLTAAGYLPVDETSLNASFQRADRIARLYARRRRDHSWAIFVAAALAVFCAVAGSLALWPASLTGFWLFWGICEFILLRYIIGHVLQSRYRDWHGHWMRYRFIAEQLRYLQIGYPLLVLPQAFQRPSWTVHTGDDEARCELVSAELWLLQRLLIAAGPPRPVAESSNDNIRHYSLTEHNALALRYFHAALEEHRDYFAHSYQRLHQDHELLHRLAMLLFSTTFVAVTVHFFVNINWILLFTAFLPAWGAAIHGILTQNELVRMSAMAGSVWQQLETLHAACSLHARTMHAHSKDYSRWEQTHDLRQLVQKLTQILSNENQHWRTLLQHKDPELPG
ncbi:MAG: hypothetical protein EA348_11535 [Pseudomonadaceae bacterium]|nr:MAG: hypothetical protein EA348_11535 [Pseudomonadaceae bacterium]